VSGLRQRLNEFARQNGGDRGEQVLHIWEVAYGAAVFARA
jgi:hypothetical protein